MRILTCEQVSDGHPDKICDQISDAIVNDCLQHDPSARGAIECLLKNNHLIIAGELTSTHEPDYLKCIDRVHESIGKERLGYSPELDVQILVKKQSPDIAMGVDVGGAGDQGLMCGYKNKTDNDEDMQIDDLEIFENVAYIMAYHADPSIPGTIEGWLDEFEMLKLFRFRTT